MHRGSLGGGWYLSSLKDGLKKDHRDEFPDLKQLQEGAALGDARDIDGGGSWESPWTHRRALSGEVASVGLPFRRLVAS